jgi:GNAT superfamily N-acetyltransferase
VNVSIRPIAPKDVDLVAELLSGLAAEFIVHEFDAEAQRQFPRENSAECIRGFIAAGFRYHVAEANGSVVGFVGVRENKHLYHLFVAKPVQRQGIGRELWEFAKRECECLGHRGDFTVNSSNNAVPIYERWGFRRDGPPKTNASGVVYNPMRLENDG